MPINGVYEPGTTVNMCFTVDGFVQTNANWFHGVSPVLGPGWDASSLVPGTSPATQCGFGVWDWYNSVTSSATGATVGPGFYFDTGNDNNPGNNYGDGDATNCSENATWTFCMDVTTINCLPGQSIVDLSVQFITYGDGETGGWDNLACDDDPYFPFNATLSCCKTPSTTIINESCINACDGSFTVEGDGTPPYDYELKNSITNAVVSTQNNIAGSTTFSSLCPGTYLVYVTDDNGCEKTVPITINPATTLSQSTIVTDVGCVSSDGSITINATGGNGIYNFSIDGGANFQLSNVFNGLNSGNYSIIVDAGNCQVDTNVSINSTLPPAFNNISQNNISCFGLSDGSINVTGTAGDGGPYLYGLNGSSPASNGGVFSNLSSGFYNIIIEDGIGCQIDSTVELTEPIELILSCDSVNPICNNNDGKIAISVSGGIPPLSYSLNNSSYISITDSIFNLSPGGYELIIQDDNNCFSLPDSIYLLDNSVIIDSINTTNITCSGQINGSIDIYASGGVSSLEYSIDSGLTFNNFSYFTGLDSNQYDVIVQDNNQCLSYQSILISSPPSISVSTILDTTVCVGGTVTSTIQFSGGSGNITYNWSNGLIGDTINWVVINDTSVYVYGVDTNGCYSDTVYQNIQTYLPLSLSMSSDVIICENDSTLITATVSGGIGSGYSYSWSGGLADTSNHYVTPNGSVSYYVTVNDACGTPPLTDSIAITVQPLPIVDFTSNLIEGCIPLTVSFSEVFSSAGICSWDFGNSNSSIQCGTVSNTYNSVGCWDVSLSYADSLNCSSSKTYSNLICSYDNPVADFNFSPQEISLLNSSVNFSSNSSSNSSQFLWELESPTSTNVFYDEDFSFSYSDYDLGDYSICLSVETDNGCIDSICKSITIKDDFIFYIPNSFTPDADGRNDDFGPIINGANQNYDFSIFNRWGEMLFSKDDNNLRWDGKHFKTGNILPNGVYVWKVEVFDEINQENKEFIGNVTLLR